VGVHPEEHRLHDVRPARLDLAEGPPPGAALGRVPPVPARQLLEVHFDEPAAHVDGPRRVAEAPGPDGRQHVLREGLVSELKDRAPVAGRAQARQPVRHVGEERLEVRDAVALGGRRMLPDEGDGVGHARRGER
jgi:hypothetical protein